MFLTLTFCKWCAVAETETDNSETEADAESNISEPEIQQNSAYSKKLDPSKNRNGFISIISINNLSRVKVGES